MNENEKKIQNFLKIKIHKIKRENNGPQFPGVERLLVPKNTVMQIKPIFSNSLLSQCLLFVDPNVKENRLHTEKHPILDLSGQHVEHHPGHRNPDVEAVPIPCDHRRRVGAETRSRLCNFEGDVSQIHHSDAHILQHCQLLTFKKAVVSTHILLLGMLHLWVQYSYHTRYHKC